MNRIYCGSHDTLLSKSTLNFCRQAQTKKMIYVCIEIANRNITNLNERNGNMMKPLLKVTTCTCSTYYFYIILGRIHLFLNKV